jgi:LytS/YehU family sensor histidine kinase
MNPSFVSDPKAWLINCLFSLGLGYPMMKFNEFIIRRYAGKIRWDINPVKRILATLGVVIILSILLTFLINYIFIFNIEKVTFTEYIRTTLNLLLIEILIIVYTFSIATGIEFFKLWKESLLKQESMQRKAVELQMEALKNQVNPHFLFNSLNTLSTLVYKDADKAAMFIMQLSDIYRYVLEHRDQATVDWQAEKQFVENYIRLQQMRFANSIDITIDTGSVESYQVVPLSVQILVENAIKHNVTTVEDPLKASIFLEDDFLVVKNKLNIRSSVENSENIGLSNIRQQYEILTGKKVVVSREGGFFTVKLPLIKKTSEHESADC